MEVPFWVVRNVSVYLNYSSVSFFAGNSFVSIIMIRIRTTATEKIPNMPSPITLSDSIKVVIIIDLHFCVNKTHKDVYISVHHKVKAGRSKTRDQPQNQSAGNDRGNLTGYIYTGCLHDQNVGRIFL